LALFPETIATFNAASVPASIYIPAVGSPSSGQTTSAIKSFSTVATGPLFNTIAGLLVFPSIGACSCSASVFYDYLLPLFGQVSSSSFSTVTLGISLFSLQKNTGIQFYFVAQPDSCLT
jgi:hypothetical protein